MAPDTAEPSLLSPAWLRWLAPAIPVVAAFALALTRMEDPDAFTHLALGRDLFEQRGWPAHEPFSFPSLDRPYYNSEWLFDVVFFLAYLAGGTAGVVVLKATLIALTVAILWRDSRSWSDAAALQPAGLLVRSAVLTAVVLLVRHRFVERPDIALMVFLAFTIYALDAYLDAGRRWIFLLPVVQIVWANTHPSIVVGLVPFVAVLGGGVALRIGVRLIQRWWRPLVVLPSWRKLGAVAAVLVGVLIASALNPHRLDALILPFTLADQPWFRQEVMELQPPTPAMWPAPFVMTALLLVSFLGTVGRLPIVPALLALPFVRLGLSAVRFVFLLELVVAPILARNPTVLAGLRAPASSYSASCWVARPTEWRRRGGRGGGDGRRPGALADPRRVAGVRRRRALGAGARCAIHARGIQGRLFNAFHFGGYIAWRIPSACRSVAAEATSRERGWRRTDFARRCRRGSRRVRARFGLDAAVMDYPVYSGDRSRTVLGPDADAP